MDVNKSMKWLAPLVLDHSEEVVMVHYALKHRAKGKPVVSAESSREPDDRNSVGLRRGFLVLVRALDLWMEM